jgi:outer membrane protein TolC
MKIKIKTKLNNQPVLILFGRRAVFIYFHVFLYISMFAQSDSLNTYLAIAAKNNPTVLQKFYEYKAALQKVPQVGGLPDPELNVGVFIQPMELIDGKEVADIRLMQMFPWFGTLKAAKDEMSLMAKAKFESFRDAKLEVFFNVKRIWNDLQKNQKEIQTSEQNLEILHMIERLTLIKFTAAPSGGSDNAQPGRSAPANSYQFGSDSQGMQSMKGSSGGSQANTTSKQGSPMQVSSMGSSSGSSGLADLYRVQIEIGELENNISLLKSQLTTITARFNAYLNRPPLSPVHLPEDMIPDSLGLSLLLVPDSILLHNPMLGMLQYEQQSLDARKKMVTRMGYPMLGLGVNYSVISKSEMSTSSMNGKDMIMPMATVTLPIYRNKYNAMKGETELLKTANKQNYTATSNSLQSDYYEAVQLFKDGERRMILYDKLSNLAEKTLDIMLKGFSTSSIPLTDILRIRQQTLDYELKKIEAVADYNSAIARLQRLMANSPVQ